MSNHTTTPYLRHRAAMRAERRAAFNQLLGGARRWWAAMADRRSARRDERFLLSQPDHILRDIGIGRSEIEHAVRGRSRR